MKLTFRFSRNLFPVLLGLGTAAPLMTGQTLIDLKSQSKNVDFSGAAATKPFKTGTSLPASCGTGESFYLANAAPGKNLYLCTAANTWSLSSGGSTPDPSASANQILSNDGSQTQWRALGGDLSGAPQNVHVTGIQGRTLSSTSPSDGNVLRWSGSNSDWEPGSLTPAYNYSKSFTNAATVTISGSEHAFGTANLIVNCYSSTTPAVLLQPSSVTVDATSFAVNVNFSSNQSGRCVINGAGGLAFAPSTGGDLSGLISNATVTGIQSRPVSSGIPTDGQVLTWSQSSAQWQPRSPAAGGGGGSGSQLSVFGVSYGNSTTLNLAAGCALSSPCNARFGSTVYSMTSGATVTLQSGQGIAYVYITSAGILTVGSNMSLTCSLGCAVVNGVTSFPTTAIPLFTWTANPLGWDPNGGSDFRSYLSTKSLAAGAGVVVVESGTQSTVSVDAAVVPTYLAGSGTLNFGSVAANSCSSELTMSLPGASAGDPVAPGWPASTPAAILGIMRISTSGTVAVKVCNMSASPVTVPSATFQATVVRSL